MPQQFVQNPAEQFESEKSPVGWPWRLLTVSSALLGLSVLVYATLAFGYRPYLDSRIADIQAQLDQLSKTVSQQERDDFVKFYSQLVNLETILNNHQFASRIFAAIEKVTHPKVAYEGATLKFPEAEVSLPGSAESFLALTEQLAAFNQSDLLESYVVNQAAVSGNAVQFKATLRFKNAILK